MGCRAKLGIESFRNRCSATAMVRSDSVIRTAAMTGISSPPHHDEMSRLRRLAVSHSLARHRHQCPLNQLGDQGFGEAALIHPFWHLLMHKDQRQSITCCICGHGNLQLSSYCDRNAHIRHTLPRSNGTHTLSCRAVRDAARRPYRPRSFTRSQFGAKCKA